MKYRAEIDGLRAFAVIPVILFHAGFSSFSGGFIGVDIFFVISGFLITTIIISELDRKNFSIVRFYERRARRILPALVFMIIISSIVATRLFAPSDLEDYFKSVLSVSVFSSNIFFWQSSGYFDTAVELKPLLHTWSLAVEEQYYLIFPVLLMVFWKFGKKNIALLIAVIAASSLALAEVGSTRFASANFYLLPTRAWELLLGSLTAFHVARHADDDSTHRPLKEALGWIGVALCVAPVFLYDASTPFPGIYAIPPTVGACLVIVFASGRTTAGRLLSTKPLVWIGLVSYSAYLWHQPIFAFARYQIEGPSPLVFSGLILATLAAAYLSWRFVEKPFRSPQALKAPFIFKSSAMATVAMVTVGTIGFATHGFESLKSTPQQREALSTAVNSPKRSECHTWGDDYLPADQSCEYATGELKWAVFGDSHAVELAYSLSQELAPRNDRVKHFSFSACPPTYGRDSSDEEESCKKWTRESIEYISDNESIENVIITYRIYSALHGNHENIYPDVPDSVPARERDARWQSLVATVEHLSQRKKNVLLVLQAPELKRPIYQLIMRDGNKVQRVAGMKRSWWNERTSYLRERLGELPKSTIVIDPTHLLCDQMNCYAARDRTAYYFDDNHLSIAGARLIAHQIVQRVSASAPPPDGGT